MASEGKPCYIPDLVKPPHPDYPWSAACMMRIARPNGHGVAQYRASLMFRILALHQVPTQATQARVSLSVALSSPQDIYPMSSS